MKWTNLYLNLGICIIIFVIIYSLISSKVTFSKKYIARMQSVNEKNLTRYVSDSFIGIIKTEIILDSHDIPTFEVGNHVPVGCNEKKHKNRGK
jgi:hypothetical protein